MAETNTEGRGDLRIDADPRDLIRAVLKGGGAPQDKKPKS